MEKRNGLWRGALAAMCAALLAGCGSAKSMGMDSSAPEAVTAAVAYDTDTSASMGGGYANDRFVADDMAAEEAEMGEGYGTAPISGNAVTERKLIKSVDLSVETEDFDGLMESIEAQAAELGGYIESMSAYNGSVYHRTAGYRHSYVTARIPAQRLDAFLDQVAQRSNITSRSESVEDVTLQYVDVESHLEALRAQQTRLMELVEQAQTVEELVFLESELTDVRYQIQSLESQLRTMSNLVSYATVYINIEEVTTYTPVAEKKSAWERMAEGFVHSCRNLGGDISEFLIEVFIHLPYILTGLLLGAAALLLIRGLVKRRRSRKARREDRWLEEPAQAQQRKEQEEEQE